MIDCIKCSTEIQPQIAKYIRTGYGPDVPKDSVQIGKTDLLFPYNKFSCHQNPEVEMILSKTTEVEHSFFQRLTGLFFKKNTSNLTYTPFLDYKQNTLFWTLKQSLNNMENDPSPAYFVLWSKCWDINVQTGQTLEYTGHMREIMGFTGHRAASASELLT